MHAILFVPVLLFAAVSDPVELGNLKSTPPAEWKAGRPTNTMQYRVFTVPKAEGDKDDTVLTIYTFGPSVGGLEANLKRWKGMIDPGEGKNIDDAAKIEKFKVADIDVVYFDAEGTYLFKPNLADASNVIRKPNYRLINVYFPTPDRVFTMRLVGPAKSVAAAEKGFKEWVKSFK
jgi:hypothetical protein